MADRRGNVAAGRPNALDGFANFWFDPLLRPNEASRLFGVSSKTLATWARAGKVPFVLTVGGHRRYRESDIRSLLAASESPRRSTAMRPSSARAGK